MATARNTCLAPIGMFDSGVGGLSVWREVACLLPAESIVYFADSGNCPYGQKSQDEIIALSDKITRFLIAQGCKIIVVACNTATAAAIDYLRATYPVSFVGMEPAVKPAALKSQTGSIGILATAGTLKGRLFNETKARFASNVNVHMQVGEGLVELVEQGKTGTPESYALLHKYIDPMMDEHIDYLVLGCTHYPFLADDIRKITNDALTIIDPAQAIARQMRRLLEEQSLLNCSADKGNYHFYSSSDIAVLKCMLDKLGVSNPQIEQRA